MKKLHCLFLAFLLMATPLFSLAEESNNSTEQIEETSNWSNHKFQYIVIAIGIFQSYQAILNMTKFPSVNRFDSKIELMDNALRAAVWALLSKVIYDLIEKDVATTKKHNHLLEKYNKLKGERCT